MANQPNQNQHDRSERDQKKACGADMVNPKVRHGKQETDRQPGSGDRSESEKSNSSDNRWASDDSER